MQLWVDLLAPVIQDMIFIATSGQWSEDNAVIRNYKVLLGDFLSHGSLITTSRKREKAGKMCDECRPKASWSPGFM